MTSRVDIARDTLAACEAGRYVRREGTRIELAAAIAAATAGTVLHDLEADRLGNHRLGSAAIRTDPARSSA